MFLPEELKKHNFNRGFLGYSTEEVDTHLAFLLEQYEGLYRENVELSRKLAAALSSLEAFMAREDKLSRLEKDMKNTAARLLADAERRQRQIIDEAAAYAEELVTGADAHVAAQAERFEEMRREILSMKESLLSVYGDGVTRIARLADIAAGQSFFDPDGEASPAPVEEPVPASEPMPTTYEDEDVYTEAELSEPPEVPEEAEEEEDYEQESFFADVYSEEELTEKPDLLEEDEPLEAMDEAEEPEESEEAEEFEEIPPEEPEEEDLPWEEVPAETQVKPPVSEEDELLLKELNDAFLVSKTKVSEKPAPAKKPAKKSRRHEEEDDEWTAILKQLEASLAETKD